MLHEMWKKYASIAMQGDSSVPGRRAIADRLYQIDLHGALVTVVRSRDPSLVGRVGVVVREHSGAFDVVTPESKVIRLIKSDSDFAMDIGAWHVTLKGPAMASRRTTRPSSRKGRKRKGA